MARFWNLETSTDTLPTSLILTQIINGNNIVLGHAKLSNVPADDNAAFLESVVVDFRYRGRGIGTFLVKEVERYCITTLNVNNVYLATYGQEVFYAKLGYIFCKAINLFGTSTIRNTTSKKHWMKKMLSDWNIEYSDINKTLTESPTFEKNRDPHSGMNMSVEHINTQKHRKCARLSVDITNLVDIWDARLGARYVSTRQNTNVVSKPACSSVYGALNEDFNKILVEKHEQSDLNVNELIRNIRHAVYNPVLQTEDTLGDLIVKIHTI